LAPNKARSSKSHRWALGFVDTCGVGDGIGITHRGDASRRSSSQGACGLASEGLCGACVAIGARHFACTCRRRRTATSWHRQIITTRDAIGACACSTSWRGTRETARGPASVLGSITTPTCRTRGDASLRRRFASAISDIVFLG